MTTKRGLFITLEGGEGAGKSVQAQAVKERLTADGASVTVTREPGGTPLGERLRTVLMDAAEPIDSLTETLLFAAARAELVSTVIGPALDHGDVVICDRYGDSTRAYQGFGRGVDLAVIDQLHNVSTGGLEPDIVILLDLSPADGLSRRPASGNDDRFGREELAFHERVRAGYLQLAAASPLRWLVVDACRTPGAVTDAICIRIQRALQDRPNRT